jgi:hypothetical protein
MSHVDDGELTAYADGAYPVNDPEALRISAHLSTCGNCRTRLEQSQELRSRAAEILAYASPASLTAPSFESLQTKVARPSARVRQPIPLAWAATIILALGIGWFGRGAWQPPIATRTAELRDTGTTVPAVVQEEQAVAPPAAAPAPQVARGTMTAPARRRDLAEADKNEVVPTERGEVAADVAVGAAAGRAAGNVAPSAPAPPPPAVETAELGQNRPLTSELAYITAAEAERRGLNLPRIPELPISRIGISVTNSVVEQTLPDGNVITLVITSEAKQEGLRSVAKSTAESRAAAPQQSRLSDADAKPTMALGGRIVAISGKLPTDSLRALLAKVRVR